MNMLPVFLASRFREFTDIRQNLRSAIDRANGWDMRAIDLNDDAVTSQSVWQRCREHVENADFMVLLMGDSYGEAMPGTEKSYTHLEYDHARRADSRTEVLVFCRGQTYDPPNKQIRFDMVREPRLAAWLRELETRHIIGYLAPELTPEQAAQQILWQLKDAVHRRTGGQVAGSPAESEAEDFGDLDFQDDQHDSVERLDARAASLRGVRLVDDELNQDPLTALLRPAAARAREQLQAAERAIRLGTYPVAIKHLRRALDEEPMNTMASYWLARLYYTVGRKERLDEILELTRMAALLAREEGRPFRQAASLILTAQATNTLGGQPKRALEYAREAVRAAPNYAQAHIEVARHQLTLGEIQHALDSVRTAHRIYPPSLREVQRDPHFRPLQSRIRDWRKGLRLRNLATARTVLETEAALQEHLSPSGTPVNLPDTASAGQAQQAARASALRQYALLSRAFTAVNEAEQVAEGKAEKLQVAREELKKAAWMWQQASPSDTRWQGVTIDAAVPASRVQQLLNRLLGTAPPPSRSVALSGQLWGQRASSNTAALEQRVRGWQRRVTELEAECRSASPSNSRLAEFVQFFEQRTLGVDISFLPFSDLADARVGSLVRYASDSRQITIGGQPRRVHFVDNMPNLSLLPAAPFSLYRCTAINTDSISLSRRLAYLPK